MIILKFKNNRTIVYALEGTFWYYCAKCIKKHSWIEKLSLLAEFCSNCGGKLDWKNTKITYTNDKKMIKKIEKFNQMADDWNKLVERERG